jgi:hypothetical protein
VFDELVKAAFNAAAMIILINVKFASVGLGSGVSVLCREVFTVKLSAPALSSR